MSNKDHVIGIDIGGTNMVVAIVNRHSGVICQRTSIPTLPEQGVAAAVSRLQTVIADLCAAANITPAQTVGIGVGCTGPVDSEAGTVNNPYTLPTWDNAPLMALLYEQYHLPWVLLNDADVAALGEFWQGAGAGSRNMIYITVGTGVGGGLVLNGRLHRGVGLAAGEIGHMVIDLNGPECYCGARGCLEMLAAAPAISAQAAQVAADDGLMLRLAGGERAALTPKIVYDAAQQGDAAAQSLLEQTGRYLGIGIANLLNTLAPDTVVLGGGVMHGWDRISPSLLQTLAERGTMIRFDLIKVCRAELGLNAGVTGAAKGLLDSLNDPA